MPGEPRLSPLGSDRNASGSDRKASEREYRQTGETMTTTTMMRRGLIVAFAAIATIGVGKAEKDFRIKAQVQRPLKGEVAEQQRYLGDVMVRGFQGMAVTPV